MLDSYRAAFGTPGAAAFSSAGALMRLPLAMYPVALVLAVALQTGDYGVGGALTAAYIAGGALGNPLLSRLADRLGQRSVLLPASAAHALAVVALVVAVDVGAAVVTLVGCAAAAGLSFPPVGALVRARWAHVCSGSPQRFSTGLAVESTLDELTFVAGPVVATVVATAIDPLAPFVLAVPLVVGGGVALHLLRGTAPRRHAAAGPRHQPFLRASTASIVVVAIAVGALLVAVDLSAIAYVGQAGRTGWTGAVLACFATGSAVAGFVYGARAWRTSPDARLPKVSVLFAALPAALLLPVDVPVLALLMLVVGVGTAPMLITLFGVLEQVVAAGRLTEGMAWLTTGLSVGAGAAAPLVGAVADSHGARVALAIPLCASVVAGVVAQVAVLLVRRQLADGPSSVGLRA